MVVSHEYAAICSAVGCGSADARAGLGVDSLIHVHVSVGWLVMR